MSNGVPATSEFSIAVQTKAQEQGIYIQYRAYKQYTSPSTLLLFCIVKQILSQSLPIAVHIYRFMVINIVLYSIMYICMYVHGVRPCTYGTCGVPLREPWLHM